MGSYKSIMICALLATSLLSAQAQVSSENYVQTSTRISDSQMQTVTQYYDGLGRPTEKVEHGVTHSGENLVHFQEYDGLGRDLRSWLPVKTSSSFLGASDVSSLSQRQYHDSRAYSAFVYDGSPLDRVVQEEGVGEDWKNHPVQTEYLINTNSFPLDCKYYRVSMQGELLDKGYYPEGRLKITKTTDEDGHESYEFKNLSDRVVLRRTMLSEKESSDTYYIYDYRGNLSFVLPPNYQEEASLDKYAYQYKYDGRGNCIWKKLPGCEPIYMRYTRNNHLAFLQDGNLRKQGDWEFYVYDKLGRMVVSGTTSSVSDVSDTYVYAQYTGTGSLDGYEVVRATINPKSLLVTNFYDDYSFIAYAEPTLQQGLHLDMANSLESAFPSNASPNARGYQTGKKVYLTDGSGRYNLSSMYYGKKGHLVQTHSTNYVGGWEHVYSSFTYAGLPLQMTHVHTGAERRTIKEEYNYKYDHAGRLTGINYGINGKSKVALSSMEYDDNGRLSKQTLPCGEVISHGYNLRNWPTAISSGKFTQKLTYNVNIGNLIPMKGTYNGNISSMSWQVGGDVQKGYFFRYNNQNMLTEAQYREGDSFADAEDHYSEHLEYDLMGNVDGLKRYGLLDDGSCGLVDDLFYIRNGNQLECVSDEVSGPHYAGAFHFVDGAAESVEYAYDANGNMIMDKNKGIVSVSYDVNSRPRQITFDDGRYIRYVYDAEGNKLSVSYNLTAMTSAQPQMAAMEAQDVVSANQEMEITTKDYCGNIVYDKGLVTVLNDVGYAECDESGDVSCYYYLKDHLGNNRVVLDSNGNIMQVNDYYATGGLMGSSMEGESQRYKYNGKELDRTHGLDWYDYGARNYDAALVVWNGVDGKSEKYSQFGNYTYCFDNPIRHFDMGGNEPGDFFLTANAAAIDFGKLYNGKSILEKIEYVSPIIAVSNENGDLGYTYKLPSKGQKCSSLIFSSSIGHAVVGLVHTHGNYSTVSDDYFSGHAYYRDGKIQIREESQLKNVQNQKGKKPTDIGTSNKFKTTIYLVSPNGKLQKYEPRKSKLTSISTELPSDKNDPNRLNKVSPRKKSINSFEYFMKLFRLLINPIKF